MGPKKAQLAHQAIYFSRNVIQRIDIAGNRNDVGWFSGLVSKEDLRIACTQKPFLVFLISDMLKVGHFITCIAFDNLQDLGNIVIALLSVEIPEVILSLIELLKFVDTYAQGIQTSLVHVDNT
jgi:hypothetical protein